MVVVRSWRERAWPMIGWVVMPYSPSTSSDDAVSPVMGEPWQTIMTLEAVTAGALALTVVGLATVLRRAGVGSVLRMGGD